MTDEELGGIVVLVWYGIVSCGIAFLLKKTGRETWKGFVPVLNAVEVCRLSGLSGWWVLSVFVPMLNLFAPMYVALKLCERLHVSSGWGILVWFSGFTLIPLVAIASDSPERLSSADGNSQPAAPSEGFESRTFNVEASATDTARRDSRTRMTVLTVMYAFCLLCFPGLMIVGTMAFGGATQAQIEKANIILALLALTPVSVLIALIGGWILHRSHKYNAASGLVVLPILNAVAVVCSFIWVVG